MRITLEGVRVTPPPPLAQEAALLRFSIGAAGLFAPPGESDELQVQPFPITEASRKLLNLVKDSKGRQT